MLNKKKEIYRDIHDTNYEFNLVGIYNFLSKFKQNIMKLVNKKEKKTNKEIEI